MTEQANGTLGQWLAEKCRSEGWSLRQTAEKSGLSHATIADITKGSQPSAESIKRLAKAFTDDGDHHRLALEDKLLTLAGYRSPRPEEATNELVARLLDKVAGFSEPQLEMVGHFLDFINILEKK